jgi:hypothetical protein
MVRIEATRGDETRAAVAAELREIREAAQESVGTREAVLPPARPTADTPEIARVAVADRVAPPIPRPDNAAVNAMWHLPSATRTGGRGLIFRLVRRLIAPVVDAQVAFNSRQVQLDNQTLDYLESRLQETHRYYDRVLGQYGQHIADANDRHLMLQRELIAHVHDLVKRIDLVLAESERGRLSLDAGLRELRTRVMRLEELTKR